MPLTVVKVNKIMKYISFFSSVVRPATVESTSQANQNAAPILAS